MVVGVLYVYVSLPEELVARMVGPGEFGPYIQRGAKFSLGRTTGGVCRCKFPILMAVYERPYVWPHIGGAVLSKGVYWFRAVGLFKRGREWLAAVIRRVTEGASRRGSRCPAGPR